MNKVIIISGAFRCGKKLLGSLLDGHPNIFVYPVEEATFFLFNDFKNGLISEKELKEKLKVKIINDPLVEIFKKINKKKFLNKLENSKINKKNFFLFSESICKIFIECFRKKKNFKFYCFFQPSGVLKFSDLNNKRIVNLVMKRNGLDSYISFYNKLENLKKKNFHQFFYSNFGKKNFIYIFYRLKLSMLIEKKIKNKINIDLIKLQSNTQIELKKIFNFLNLKIKKINLKPTIFGLKKRSNLTSGKDNFKVRGNLKTKDRFKKFEKLLFRSLDFGHNEKLFHESSSFFQLYLNSFYIFNSNLYSKKLILFLKYNLNFFYLFINYYIFRNKIHSFAFGLKKDRLIKNLLSQI